MKSNFGTWFRGMTMFGKGATILIIAAALYFGKMGYDKMFPKKVKKSIAVRSINIPPLTYDKGATTTFRPLPSFNEPSNIEGKEIRGHLMGWNAASAIPYAVGGKQTSRNSLCEQFGLNIVLDVQNACTKQAEDLYAFAEELSSGNPTPSKGCHFVNWMGDGCPNYLAGLNERIRKDFGEDYVAQVLYFTGASFGEDKWLLTPKYKKDPRGSLTVTVLRDGD